MFTNTRKNSLYYFYFDILFHIPFISFSSFKLYKKNLLWWLPFLSNRTIEMWYIKWRRSCFNLMMRNIQYSWFKDKIFLHHRQYFTLCVMTPRRFAHCMIRVTEKAASYELTKVGFVIDFSKAFSYAIFFYEICVLY